MKARKKESHYVCISCGRDKPEKDFPVDNSTTTGRKGRCRECVNVKDRELYLKRKKAKGIPDRGTAQKRKSPAKVLILDIETAPLRSYTWGVWKQNIAPNQIIDDWFMLTWAAKWLFDDAVHSDKMKPQEAVAQNDRRIAMSAWQFLNEADIVIAHNANRFDIKRINTRFVVHGMNPPMPYQVIDTLEHIKKRFSMTHNRLDYVNKKLGLDRKKDTGGFELWDRCYRGEGRALSEMEEYNRVDVMILEETYLRIRPWIKPHPNIGLYIGGEIDRCPTCGGGNLSFGNKPYATTANLYTAFRCVDCGAVGRSKKALPNNSTTRSVPK